MTEYKRLNEIQILKQTRNCSSRLAKCIIAPSTQSPPLTNAVLLLGAPTEVTHYRGSERKSHPSCGSV